MKKILSLLILIAFATSSIVSLSSCEKLSSDGRKCQQCKENFHVFNGFCYSNIQNCLSYKNGITCQSCREPTILVSNSCLDNQILKSMLKPEDDNIQEFIVEENLNRISKLVEFVERGFLRGNGRLIKFSVKQYEKVWRWFLLYLFDGQFKNYQRIIVDMDLKTQVFSAIDFSSLRNLDEFTTLLWRDINVRNNFLQKFSDFYTVSTDYLKIQVRKAILSQIQEFEILTVSKDRLEIREICSSKTGNYLLSEFVQSLGTTLTENFRSYQLTFEGSQIDAELDVNDGFSAAVNIVKNSASWNHTLTKVIQIGKASDLTQYTITGQNKESEFKAVVHYNPVDKSVKIVKLSIQALDQHFSSFVNLPEQKAQSASNKQYNKKHVEQQGCESHTTYSAPFDGQLKTMADKLSKIKRDQALSAIKPNLDSETPFIQAPTLSLRRIVVTSFCSNYNYREVAYVEGDGVSNTEYFTYYLEEENNDQKNWYLLGTRNKTQPSTVYSNPQAFPVNMVDPSFVVYPYANLYTQKGVANNYMNNLSDDDRMTFMGLYKNLTTEKDRKLGKMQRYALDSKDSSNKTYRSAGWVVIQLPIGFYGFEPRMSMFCDQLMFTETLIIGSSGPQEQKTIESQNKSRNNLIRRSA